MRVAALTLFALVVGCPVVGCAVVEPTPGTCDYPETAEPMAVGSPLPAYRWPAAIDAQDTNVPLDLARVPCANDDNIDWSPFDHLLFVSIPAW